MKILASFMQNNQLVSLSSILNLVLGKSYFKSCYIYIYIYIYIYDRMLIAYMT
jgi:hypothetical protein